MKITFYDGHGKLSYNPNTEKSVGIGGAETVIIQSAKALAKRGHDVSVYINCNFPDYYDGVAYYKYQDYTPKDEDVFVGFENFPVKYGGKKIINWSNRFYIDDVLKYPNVDKRFVMSDWHKDYYVANLPKNLVDKLVVVNPGVISDFFESTVAKQPYNITYTGHPGKGGMAVLPSIMERLKPKLPKADIHVYGGGAMWGWNNDQYRPIYDKLIKYGIKFHGQIGKEDMVTRLNQAEIFLYPVGNHHKETFCLGVLEAMASGCVVISSDSGNVKNLIKDCGYIIEGDINHYSWAMEAVEKISKLYNEPKLMEYYSKKSKEFAKQFTWDKTAEKFEQEVAK
jgi:glycosyltransferase involved in cell wall biosynthesis